jgi:hypothetical protein
MDVLGGHTWGFMLRGIAGKFLKSIYVAICSLQLGVVMALGNFCWGDRGGISATTPPIYSKTLSSFRLRLAPSP